MKRKRIAIFLCTISILVYSGCGAESDEQLRSTEDQHTEDMGDIEEKSEAESIQDEIAKAEAESCEYENADRGSMEQPEIQESIDLADPKLDDVFQKFEGQWIFDEKRGACIGIERTEACAYGVEGSNWTIWETGGDIISDLDVYGYTENSVLFKVAHDGFDAFYELSSDVAGSIRFAYGTSLDAMDEVVEAGRQEGGDTDPEMTAEELLDLFIDGSISAVYSADPTSSFYITDLNMGSEEWDSYSVGEKVDLDNDGENELVINGPYGGRYLDARDNRVYEFAVAGGTALVLSYTYYNGAVWIMYSNTSSAGFGYYHLEKFDGADNLVAEMNFGEEFDVNHAEAGLKYTLNGTEISSEEYTELCSKIFAAEVSTN